MHVFLSSHLRDYTQQQAQVEATGDTLGKVLIDLDRQYPGLKFRILDEREQIRPHINVFVNGDRVRDLTLSMAAVSEVHLLAALSGG